jgi:hypothetical protein
MSPMQFYGMELRHRAYLSFTYGTHTTKSCHYKVLLRINPGNKLCNSRTDATTQGLATFLLPWAILAIVLPRDTVILTTSSN